MRRAKIKVVKTAGGCRYLKDQFGNNFGFCGMDDTVARQRAEILQKSLDSGAPKKLSGRQN
jgi:hypothetical protein